MQKTPILSRPRRSPEDWQALVKQFEAANQSRTDFCALHNIGLDSFRIWFRKLRERARPPQAQTAFLAVKVVPGDAKSVSSGPSASVEFLLKNNRSIIVRDVCLKTQLAELIEIAESVPSC